MAKKLPSISEAFEDFECSLNEERYYDAHEDIEALWFLRRFDDDDEVRLWKGFINAAVSFELIKKGRPTSCVKAWRNYQKYLPLLGQFDTQHHDIYAKTAKKIGEIHSLLYQKDE